MIDAEIIELGLAAEFKAGYPFRGSVEPVPGGAVAVVQMKDVAPSGGLDWLKVVRTELTGRKDADWLAEDDLLLVARGNRYYAAVLNDVPEQAVCGPHLYQLRLKRKINAHFLAWQINQPPIQKLLRQAAEGSSQLSIRRAELEALPISVPSAIVQEQIVQLARAADRERELLNKLIQNRGRLLNSLAIDLAEAHSQQRRTKE